MGEVGEPKKGGAQGNQPRSNLPALDRPHVQFHCADPLGQGESRPINEEYGQSA